MSQYYLVSQLPSLDGISDSVPLPITEERFFELCSRFLGKKSFLELNGLTLIPPKNPQNINSPLLESWYTVERNLRLALGKFRAEKLNKSFDFGNTTLPTELLQTARTAVEFDNPLEAEKFLGKKSFLELNGLTLIPPKFPENINSPLLESWYTIERNLRLALGKFRAEKLNKTFEFGNITLPTELLQTARAAVEFDNPLEAEKFLNNFRLKALEALRPMDTFSEDYLFYYAIKLKLILRIREFDKTRGQTAYRNIYDSVINRAESEVE